MNITANTAENNQEYDLSQDQTGLDEIQKALDKIERLNQTEEETVETEEDKSSEEELVGKEASEEEADQKKEKREDKLWKIKKDKYRALAEKEVLLQENLQLKKMLDDSLNSGTYHYSKSTYSDLERAKENKKKAIEDGNVEALIEADIALTKALHTVNELEKLSYKGNNQNINENYNNFSSSDNLNIVQQEIASDWLENHSYLQPTSPDYNPKIANQVAAFVNYLDANLAKNGERDLYFTDPYFETIENYITQIKSESQKNSKKIESSAHIAPVRNSYTGSISSKTSSPTQMILSADEKRMCANANIPEKEWLRYKLEELKKGK